MFRPILIYAAVTIPGALYADPVFVTDEAAIRGYDPVAYHVGGKAVKGRKDLEYRWQDTE